MHKAIILNKHRVEHGSNRFTNALKRYKESRYSVFKNFLIVHLTQLFVFFNCFKHLRQDRDACYSSSDTHYYEAKENHLRIIIKAWDPTRATNHKHGQCDKEPSNEYQASFTHMLGNEVHKWACDGKNNSRNSI